MNVMEKLRYSVRRGVWMALLLGVLGAEPISWAGHKNNPKLASSYEELVSWENELFRVSLNELMDFREMAKLAVQETREDLILGVASLIGPDEKAAPLVEALWHPEEPEDKESQDLQARIKENPLSIQPTDSDRLQQVKKFLSSMRTVLFAYRDPILTTREAMDEALDVFKSNYRDPSLPPFLRQLAVYFQGCYYQILTTQKSELREKKKRGLRSTLSRWEKDGKSASLALSSRLATTYFKRCHLDFPDGSVALSQLGQFSEVWAMLQVETDPTEIYRRVMGFRSPVPLPVQVLAVSLEKQSLSPDYRRQIDTLKHLLEILPPGAVKGQVARHLAGFFLYGKGTSQDLDQAENYAELVLTLNSNPSSSDHLIANWILFVIHQFKQDGQKSLYLSRLLLSPTLSKERASRFVNRWIHEKSNALHPKDAKSVRDLIEYHEYQPWADRILLLELINLYDFKVPAQQNFERMGPAIERLLLENPSATPEIRSIQAHFFQGEELEKDFKNKEFFKKLSKFEQAGIHVLLGASYFFKEGGEPIRNVKAARAHLRLVGSATEGSQQELLPFYRLARYLLIYLTGWEWGLTSDMKAAPQLLTQLIDAVSPKNLALLVNEGKESEVEFFPLIPQDSRFLQVLMSLPILSHKEQYQDEIAFLGNILRSLLTYSEARSEEQKTQEGLSHSNVEFIRIALPLLRKVGMRRNSSEMKQIRSEIEFLYLSLPRGKLRGLIALNLGAMDWYGLGGEINRARAEPLFGEALSLGSTHRSLPEAYLGIAAFDHGQYGDAQRYLTEIAQSKDLPEQIRLKLSQLKDQSVNNFVTEKVKTLKSSAKSFQDAAIQDKAHLANPSVVEYEQKVSVSKSNFDHAMAPFLADPLAAFKADYQQIRKAFLQVSSEVMAPFPFDALVQGFPEDPHFRSYWESHLKESDRSIAVKDTARLMLAFSFLLYPGNSEKGDPAAQSIETILRKAQTSFSEILLERAAGNEARLEHRLLAQFFLGQVYEVGASKLKGWGKRSKEAFSRAATVCRPYLGLVKGEQPPVMDINNLFIKDWVWLMNRTLSENLKLQTKRILDTQKDRQQSDVLPKELPLEETLEAPLTLKEPLKEDLLVSGDPLEVEKKGNSSLLENSSEAEEKSDPSVVVKPSQWKKFKLKSKKTRSVKVKSHKIPESKTQELDRVWVPEVPELPGSPVGTQAAERPTSPVHPPQVENWLAVLKGFDPSTRPSLEVEQSLSALESQYETKGEEVNLEPSVPLLEFYYYRAQVYLARALYREGSDSLELENQGNDRKRGMESLTEFIQHMEGSESKLMDSWQGQADLSLLLLNANQQLHELREELQPKLSVNDLLPQPTDEIKPSEPSEAEGSQYLPDPLDKKEQLSVPDSRIPPVTSEQWQMAQQWMENYRQSQLPFRFLQWPPLEVSASSPLLPSLTRNGFFFLGEVCKRWGIYWVPYQPQLAHFFPSSQ